MARVINVDTGRHPSNAAWIQVALTPFGRAGELARGFVVATKP